VWQEVLGWESFSRWSLGKQLVESADGIAATMIEGYYRNSRREQARFFRYALSSGKETALWCWRAKERGLLSSPERYHSVRTSLDALLPQTMNYIKSSMNE